MAAVKIEELRRRSSPRRGLTIAIGVVLLAAAAAVIDFQVEQPRIHVRWTERITPEQRAVLEQRYGLVAGEPVDLATWRYEAHDRSVENIRALIADAAVDDTAYIDRPTLAVPEIRYGVAFEPQRLWGPFPGELVQVQSILLLAVAVGLLRVSAFEDARRRRAFSLVALAVLMLLMYAVPLHQPIRMGDSDTYTKSRAAFESYSGVRFIRFEAHLSHALLGMLDAAFGRTSESPSQAMRSLAAIGTALFAASMLLAGVVERWSPVVVRYLALCVVAPAALLYFGYLELGYLSLNVAAFPLLVRGLRQGGVHLEASAATSGVGAALHGFGLLALAGSGLACLGASRPLAIRGALVLRFAAWGMAAYLSWIALYVIVLKLAILPGHADAIPLRPWFADAIADRVNAAVFSSRGLRDIALSAWIAGVPLVVMAASMYQRLPEVARAALLFTIPSAVFLVLFWPIQGLAVEMDLIVAAFPAVYALAWVCAHDRRQTLIAALLLASGQIAFWRVVFDSAFVNSRLP